MKIIGVLGREIYDSNGLPTVQCQLVIENGISVCSSVPSKKSIGAFEAYELRDGGERLFGRGVLDVVKKIEDIIAPKLIGMPIDAIQIDKLILELDGTATKSNLGANATLAISMAAYRAHAFSLQMELYEFIYHLTDNVNGRLPQPVFTIAHAVESANDKLFIKEFMIIPIGNVNFRSALESGVIFFQELKQHLHTQGKSVLIGEKGAFINAFSSDEEALDTLYELMSSINQKYGYSYVLGLDISASNYYDNFNDLYNFKDSYVSSARLIDYYETLIENYPIYSIEDGLSEIDYQGWASLTARLRSKAQIIGNKIFCTNIYRIAQGINESLATSVIIKPNQVGTITEVLQMIQICKEASLSTVLSQGSGETEDTFIADLAMGSGADHIQFGGLCYGEQISKYNRLLYIEDKLAFNG